ncbi:VOC family protein [Bacillus suaedaesalsae]|uniref:VOC family protein n=1 Tax=Bacillus suaedaesalsae TaxID=2810349 RepID=A0ABS2DGG9_9BACI|nr:VOC family protein [Bacillus suaedaesalsae]MBM6617553.1 VOC family protein [Bacillus suaedaesalsae]
MKKRGAIHHLELYVSNLQESLQFWDWFLKELGYKEYQQWEKGKSYKLDYTYLVFVQVEEKYKQNPYHRKGVGLNHLAFHVNTKEEVDEFARAVKERGCTLLYEERYPFAGGQEYYALFFEDPDRIKVEVVAS